MHDDRYTMFKGAIGCIDGTHIARTMPRVDQLPYRNRKGVCSFDVMAVCDFDMNFTFVSVGWEGSAHNAHVFDHALKTASMNFPHPPPGRYYLVDKRYPDRVGYVVLYSKIKYYLSQFQNVVPRNAKQAFNKVHSSVRSANERCFGVLKKRFCILTYMASYPIETQIDLILVCFAIHNLILRYRIEDNYLENEYDDPDLPPHRRAERADDRAPGGMREIRYAIAAEIWLGKRYW